LIVQGSVCVGLDCVSTESFGFDTIRLKENNTRIKFEDTSVGAFPSTDWQLTANDSASGGLNKFSIEDVTAASVPFTIEGAATTNSIYVDSSGRVGLRTSTPVLDLHIVTGNTPAIRLEQNASSGFTAQTWDIASNEASFFVRDVTSGSLLPFRVFPGAPSNSLAVEGTGDVGIGTTSPDVRLHVLRSGAGAADMLRLENTGGNPSLLMENGNNGNIWEMTAGANYIVRIDGGANLMALSTAGNLTIAGQITTTGSCSIGCDRVFDPAYDLPTIREHAEAMMANKYLPAVGPTVEGQPMNLSRTLEGVLNELEKAHIYITQLEERLAVLEEDR
jgi:hypothetical protein